MTEKPYIMITEPPITIPTPTLSNLEKNKKSDDLIIELKTKVGSKYDILVKNIINEINSLGIYSINLMQEGGMVTMDYKMNRFRVFIENGIIKGMKQG